MPLTTWHAGDAERGAPPVEVRPLPIERLTAVPIA